MTVCYERGVDVTTDNDWVYFNCCVWRSENNGKRGDRRYKREKSDGNLRKDRHPGLFPIGQCVSREREEVGILYVIEIGVCRHVLYGRRRGGWGNQ